MSDTAEASREMMSELMDGSSYPSAFSPLITSHCIGVSGVPWAVRYK